MWKRHWKDVRVPTLMKIRMSIPVMLLLAICVIAAGCASTTTATDSRPMEPGHNPSLVLPTDSMIELAAADQSEMWELSRNDPQMGGQSLPRDAAYRVVETRQWEVLGTSNGRPRDYSYTRIRTYTRDGR